MIKFANTSNRGRVCLFYHFIVIQFIHIGSCKIYVITVCHEDIYGRSCIQKSNNDHFHPYFDIIVFNMERFSFPVVSFTCLPPEEPRDIVFIPSVLKRVQRWRIS